jgi:hypothetical protein
MTLARERKKEIVRDGEKKRAAFAEREMPNL